MHTYSHFSTFEAILSPIIFFVIDLKFADRAIRPIILVHAIMHETVTTWISLSPFARLTPHSVIKIMVHPNGMTQLMYCCLEIILHGVDYVKM